MASGEYSTYGGGALRLKGTKVKKHGKKKKDKESSLEKALSTGESPSRPDDDRLEEARQDKADGDSKETRSRGRGYGGEKSEGEGGDAPVTYKTESERRFAEARRKKLLEMPESASGRPELLKTHKQRVEELNTYLSKLSEHHDMPKIGPG